MDFWCSRMTDFADAPFAEHLLPDPSDRLATAYRTIAKRMEGLNFVNPAIEVEAVGFAA